MSVCFVGAYKTHMFKMQLDLGPHDVAPDTYNTTCYVAFKMPNSTVSRAQIRSVSLSDNADTTDKWVHHLAKYEYKVEMEFQHGKKETPIIPPEITSPTSPESPAPESEVSAQGEEADGEEDDSSETSSDEEE